LQRKNRRIVSPETPALIDKSRKVERRHPSSGVGWQRQFGTENPVLPIGYIPAESTFCINSRLTESSISKYCVKGGFMKIAQKGAFG
jgi:hypothetical protein